MPTSIFLPLDRQGEDVLEPAPLELLVDGTEDGLEIANLTPAVQRKPGGTLRNEVDVGRKLLAMLPVKLVEDGRLRALVMSRNPSKEFKESTGHGRGQYRPRASVGCLVVAATSDSDSASLRAELLEACQDEDLEYGMRIASLGSAGGGGRYSRFSGALDFMGYSSRGGTTPLAVYKVHPDGKEELVRGAQIAQISLKAFKRVLAAGDKPYVLNSGGVSGGQTVVVPAMLFEELDLTEIDQDFDKPPIIPNPLVRESDR